MKEADLIEVCRELPRPIYVMAHPASGTKWLQKQLSAALDGPVAHEILRGRPIRDYAAVICFKHWTEAVVRKYASLIAVTRDPLRVIPSTYALYNNTPHIRGTVLMQLFGDGLPHGEQWCAAQSQDPFQTCLSTLDAWYFKAHQWDSRIHGWYRLEDAKAVIEAPSNTKLHKIEERKRRRTTWEEIINTDPVVAARLMREARRMGYDNIPPHLSAVI